MLYDFCRFAGQGKDEVILFRSHRHVLRLLGRIVELFLLYCGISIGIGLLGYAILKIMDLPYENTLGNAFFSMFYLSLVTAVMAAWSLWYRSMCIITDSRIVKIVPKGFFFSYTRELKLDGVKDTSFSYENFFQGLFNYGKLNVIGGGQFLIKFIPNPRDIHHYITKLMRLIDQAKVTGQRPVFPEFIPRPQWQGKKFRAPTIKQAGSKRLAS
ncbi:PH domain-containing protein [Candidatus Gracilibacteria bacterium]|nr:PH domain-containing protein [Candidatus Gracilibacteria bacterium]